MLAKIKRKRWKSASKGPDKSLSNKTPQAAKESEKVEGSGAQHPGSESTSDDHGPEPPECRHDRVVAVIVHRTDKIKSKLYISHPTVKVHVVSSSTGQYLKKSVVHRPGVYVFEKANVDHLLPLMTKPSNFRLSQTGYPDWEELLLFNESYAYMTDPKNEVLLIFEMLDFMSMEALKTQTNVSRIQSEDGTSGWYRIAWAFLKIVSSSGELNCGKKLRLQLYRAPRKTRMKDDQQAEVYHWYKNLPKIQYPGSLYVTVKSTTPPGYVPSVTRSMFAVQPEGVEGGEGATDVNANEEKAEEKAEQLYLWSRLPGQPCKVPNKQILTLAAGKLGCFSVQFSTNGRLIACAGSETQKKHPIFIYSIPDGMTKGVCLGHVNLVYELKFNLNSAWLLSASADCTARLWDTSSFVCIQTFPHTTFVYCAKFHPANENLIVTGCFDKRIRVWQRVEDLEGQIIQELAPHSSYINALSFSIDGLTLYSGDGLGSVRIWDTPVQSSGRWVLRKELKEDELQGKPVNSLFLHPDQKRLFVQSRDGVIRVIELRAYALRHRFAGFENNRLHLRCTVTPCGTFLLAGSETGNAIVWHIPTGKKVAEYNRLMVGEHPVASVAYHPLDHIVAFAVFAEAQLLQVYRYDPSAPELYKEDVKSIDVQPAKPTFDPDFSVAKLLEEHRLLAKYELVTYSTKKSTQPSVVVTREDSDEAKPMEQIDLPALKRKPAASPARKHVSFKSPSQSPEVAKKHLTPEIQVIAPRPLLVPSLSEEGRQPSMFEKTFSVSDEEEEAQTKVPEGTGETAPAEEAEAVEGTEETTVLFTVVAKHNYTAQNEDEISFEGGSVINVVSDSDPNWWVGFVDEGKIGYFPSNFVRTSTVADATDVIEL